MDHFRREETGYQGIQGTKPQTLAYGLNDSPAGLAAWITEKFRTWTDCGGDLEWRVTKDQLLSNIMIYWVGQSITRRRGSTTKRGIIRGVPTPKARRDPHRCRYFPRRNPEAAAPMGRSRLQYSALDGNAAWRPLRRDGRAGPLANDIRDFFGGLK